MNSSILARCHTLLASCKGRIVVQTRLINSTPVCNLIQSWREKKGLPLNPNIHGPLTDKPDYTFLDGRPVPLGMRKQKRMMKQKEIAMKIVQLSKEMDFAVERHQANLKAEENCKKNILENKLQPKGHLLLKKKN